MAERRTGVGFGERLQREREMRGITLDEIANATKIGTRSLRALEEEDFHKLPGGIFNKGFVRAYARYLGINEEQAVADYMLAVGESERKDSPLDQERLKKIEANWKPPRAQEPEREFNFPWMAVLVILVLALSGLAAWHSRHQVISRYQEWKARRHPQAQVTTVAPASSTPGYPSPAAAPATTPDATQNPAAPGANAVPQIATAPSGATAAPRASLAAGLPTAGGSQTPADKPLASGSKAAASDEAGAAPEFVLQIHARQDSWVSIIADGKSVMKGVLIASRDTSVRAKQKVTLTAGNAGGIEVSFNGKPQPSLGTTKEVRTVTFTPEGMQQ